VKKPTKIDTKDPDETILLSFDFTEYLNSGETVASATYESVIKVGTDPSAAGMITGTPTSGTICKTLVKDGLHNNDYVVSCIATTTLGQKIKLSYYVPVRSQELYDYR
jgi:hypothetical protein